MEHMLLCNLIDFFVFLYMRHSAWVILSAFQNVLNKPNNILLETSKMSLN